MKAVVTYVIDHVVMTDTHHGESITAKIRGGGRGYVKVDGVDVLYRRIEKIVVDRRELEK